MQNPPAHRRIVESRTTHLEETSYRVNLEVWETDFTPEDPGAVGVTTRISSGQQFLSIHTISAPSWGELDALRAEDRFDEATGQGRC